MPRYSTSAPTVQPSRRLPVEGQVRSWRCTDDFVWVGNIGDHAYMGMEPLDGVDEGPWTGRCRICVQEDGCVVLPYTIEPAARVFLPLMEGAPPPPAWLPEETRRALLACAPDGGATVVYWEGSVLALQGEGDLSCLEGIALPEDAPADLLFL